MSQSPSSSPSPSPSPSMDSQPSPSPSSKSSSIADRINMDGMSDDQRLEWELEQLSVKPPPRLDLVLSHVGENVAFGRWLDSEQRGHEAYTKFYIGAERYKQLAKNGPGPQLGAARILYESHIKNDSHHNPPQPLSAISIPKEQISRIQAALAAKATPMDLFDVIQKLVLDYISTFMPRFITSFAYLNLQLEGILLHPDRAPMFMRIAKNIYKEEYPMFYEEWEIFHTALINHAKTRQHAHHIPDGSPRTNITVINSASDSIGISHNRKSSQNDFVDEQLNQLQTIFNKYIKYRAEYRLDVSDQMKNEVLDSITKCRRVNRIPIDILDPVVRRACDIMRWEIVPEFLREEEIIRARAEQEKKASSPERRRNSRSAVSTSRRHIPSSPSISSLTSSSSTTSVPFTIQENAPSKIKSRSSYSPKALQRLLAQAAQAQAAKELEKQVEQQVAALAAAQSTPTSSSNGNKESKESSPPSSLPILPVAAPIGTSIDRFRAVKVDVPSSARRHSIALGDLVLINRARDQQRSAMTAFEQTKAIVGNGNTPMVQQLQMIENTASQRILKPISVSSSTSSLDKQASPQSSSSKSFISPSTPTSAALLSTQHSSSAAGISAAVHLTSYHPIGALAGTSSTPTFKAQQIRSNITQSSPGLGGSITSLAPAALSLGQVQLSVHSHTHTIHATPSSACSSNPSSVPPSSSPRVILSSSSSSSIVCPVPAHPAAHVQTYLHVSSSSSSHTTSASAGNTPLHTPSSSPSASPGIPSTPSPGPYTPAPQPHMKERHPNPKPPGSRLSITEPSASSSSSSSSHPHPSHSHNPSISTISLGPISLNHKTPYPRHAHVRRSSTSLSSQISESSDDSNLDLYSTPQSHHRQVSNASPAAGHRVTQSQDLFPFDYSSSRAFGYSADDLELIQRRPYMKTLQYALFFPANPGIITSLRRRSIVTEDKDPDDTIGTLASISESAIERSISKRNNGGHGNRSVRFSFDITEILDSSGRKKKDSVSSDHVKSCLKKKVRKETYEEVITRVFQERQRESAMLLQVMLHGTTLTKFNSLGKPAERWFTVSPDGTELSWCKVDIKKNRAKSGLFTRSKKKMLADCLRMRYGSRNSRRFQRYNDDGNPPWLAFSIFFPDRSLDIVCTSDQQVTTWFLGLQSLAPLSSSYLTLGGLLWTRASMKAKFFARRQKQNDMEYIDGLLEKARDDLALENGPSRSQTARTV